MALTTNTTLKGNGFESNVRSGLLERTIDASKFNLAASTNYEIGDLPAGFVPRTVAALVLREQKTGTGYDASASTVTLKIKSDESTVTTCVLGGDSKADGYKLMIGATTASSTTTLSILGKGETLCVTLNNAATNGIFKIAVAGDFMTGDWDKGYAKDAADPSKAVPTTVLS